MKQKEVLKKLLERIRGFKIGDYVKYKFEENKTWYYGIIDDITEDRKTILIKRKGRDWIDLIFYPRDTVHLVKRRKKA